MRWIVFDCGEVISAPTQALPELAAVLGADPVSFEHAYWVHRLEYDRGWTELQYWQQVGTHCGAEVDPPTAAQLTKIDTAGWLVTDPATVDLLGDLHAAGARLALLSNAPSSFGRAAESQPWTRYFEHLLFSGDLGFVKPEAEIWAALLERLNARAADCVFYDDRRHNVDGAVAAGLTAKQWTTAADARQHLAALGVL
ncbi:HAD family hydrolase [Actinocrispum wychmicini]|uniref:Putative hydrolase of the HAD superfamily n=1 Tax=Actinocrispum wychmicini TaxID=1213861 RepID=A0A4R2JWL0_9PSEU|nr:HAD family phosphatase [Actinocrispum wychmicini]TCO64891.1 putative hydrolase of the HAD superfamily [Actinocrispum wychmicini]